MRNAPTLRPARLVIRAAAAGAVTVLLPTVVSLFGAATAGAATAGAATVADCSSGVIVAVDLSQWENGVIDAVCDSVPPANAAGALMATGFDPTPVTTYGFDFICQIAGTDGVEYPQGADCSTTPPADAYWSFWYADIGQDSWTYSSVGAASLEPQPGSVEAWIFGGDTGGSQPAGFSSPNEIRAETTQVVSGSGKTTTAPPSSGAPTGSSGTGSNGPTAPQGATAEPGGTSTPAPAAATTSTTAPTRPAGGVARGRPPSATGGVTPSAHPVAPSSPTSTTSRGGNGERIISAIPAVAARHPGSGSPLSFLVGGTIVLVLVAVAGMVSWARRRERSKES